MFVLQLQSTQLILTDTAADRWYGNPKNSTCSNKTKRKQPDHHTPPKATEKKSKANQTKCLICEETILEPDEKTYGHDEVYYEGDCQGWMHRQCAGLSRFNFDKLGESIMPYLCTYCTLNKQYKEICTLKDTVQTLTNRITELEAAYKSSVSKPAAA